MNAVEMNAKHPLSLFPFLLNFKKWITMTLPRRSIQKQFKKIRSSKTKAAFKSRSCLLKSEDELVNF
jgi:hypothetical protein